jgi:hypothetical protein
MAEQCIQPRRGFITARVKNKQAEATTSECSKARTFLLVTIVAAAIALSGVGCAEVDHTVYVEPGTFVVPGDQAWVSTGVVLDIGQNLVIEEAVPSWQILVKGSRNQAVSARGTYLFDVDNSPFPLEPNRAHNDRRYPGYCLIGRIGKDGAPFFVGSNFKGVATEAGTLWLGINDPEPQKNRGLFTCRISLDSPDLPQVKPALPETKFRVETQSNPTAPTPVPDANVVILFVDGLRPDVAVEMAEWGHLPNFRELFLENGVWVRNSFTVQPSLTLTSFASMITGNYSNRHGIKMQCYYDREADAYINGLSVLHYTRFANEVEAREVKAIYDYFPDNFAGTAMPFEPLKPHILQVNMSEWLHRAINTANYSSKIKSNMDAVQTRYALDLVSSPKVKVMLAWLPSNDVVSEQTPHGQFGGARQTIARMDGDIGKIVERLKIRNRFDNTYFILVSDHGHIGGDEMVNRRFDVMREIFHAYLQMNVVGMWHRFDFPGAPADRLGAVSDSDGGVGIFLPLGNVDSGNMAVPGTYEQLSHYGLADGTYVNAVELFAEYSAKGRWASSDTTKRPVDFAVAKVDADTVLLYKTMERQALIHSRRNADGVFEFKYEPVRNYALNQPLEPIASGDPLGYLDNEDFRKAVGDVPTWLKDYHTGPEWLGATYKTTYPGCVNTLNLYFRWDGPVTEDSPVPSQPDILLFSSKGWVFEPSLILARRNEHTIGSRHGMASREATNNCLFVSGPGIRKATIIETPHRIVDIMPTVLQMRGIDPSTAEMDGQAMREIWEGIQ